jgi:hypothetical protein
MARNNHPAISLDPSDRANQPFVVTPTPASAKAATSKSIEATGRYDAATAGNLTVWCEVRGDSASVEFEAVNSIGISVSDDSTSASADAAAFVVFRLRGLYARARWGPVLGLLG